jgi:hypothetical protein
MDMQGSGQSAKSINEIIIYISEQIRKQLIISSFSLAECK